MKNTHTNAIAALIAYAGYLAFLLRVYRYIERPMVESNIRRHNVRQELMWQIENNTNVRDILRVGPSAFRTLVGLLKQKNLLKDTCFSNVEEQVANFLCILAHNMRNRFMNFFFRRSGEAISRHFHQVLKVIISLEDEFLVQPNGSTVPPEILNSEGRFYPYFKVKNEYKLVRDKELYFLEDVRDLFEKDRANGDGATNAKEKVRKWQSDRGLQIDESDEIQVNNEMNLDNQDPSTQFAQHSPSRDSFSSTSHQ
ncbi:hypothetical protein GH714_008052 [Hevea brasiliensis]|uniref:DUF8040 domain-containing protein n=1 Tax=Hevea brasiliensis TaxID=3981 RepID=A0A6A6KNI6_HEVBR|nr:hypothetical protein GH714_008052 [Hevea brasiliensis]